MKDIIKKKLQEYNETKATAAEHYERKTRDLQTLQATIQQYMVIVGEMNIKIALLQELLEEITKNEEIEEA